MKTKLLVIFITIGVKSFSQSTNGTPQVTNIGGGSSSAGNISLEWSIGESSSIETYMSGILYLYSGLLQTSTSYPFIRNIEPGQIKLGPNPFRDKIKVETVFKTQGRVLFNVYDIFGRAIFSKEIITFFEYLNESLILYKLLNGIYYLEIVYSDQTNQKIRSVHKIIKY